MRHLHSLAPRAGNATLLLAHTSYQPATQSGTTQSQSVLLYGWVSKERATYLQDNSNLSLTQPSVQLPPLASVPTLRMSLRFRLLNLFQVSSQFTLAI